jgi:hypothetical protein
MHTTSPITCNNCITNLIFGFKIHLAEMGIFNFPFIWHFIYLLPFKIILFVIVSMMANEYSYGTLKQNLIDGLSKKGVHFV